MTKPLVTGNCLHTNVTSSLQYQKKSCLGIKVRELLTSSSSPHIFRAVFYQGY